MKKLLIILTATIILISLYVTPLWGMETVDEIILEETDTIETNEHDEGFMIHLQAGVEEVLNVDTDIQEEVQEIEDTNNTITYSGWMVTKVNIRKEPNTESEILGTLEFNEKIEYQLHNNKWVKFDYNGIPAYVYKNYISDTYNQYKEYSVPENDGFKSYMSYKAITNKSSKQYKLQKNHAYTNNSGIRMANNRYCIALGTAFNAPVGTYVDLLLKNGTIISCVVAEIKSDQHTNSDNIVTSHNGCITEFLVDTDILNNNIKRGGDVSFYKKDWNSPVKSIRVYKKNIL